METRKFDINGVVYNVLTDEELDDLLAVRMYEERKRNNELELTDIDDFIAERKKKYDL